ncbi:hypothetical protein [Mycoplasmopsis felis]|uniref:Uncharacterized protein n=1 Tax=Mycoplasmopsis felis TaxID=33923 RepID=A0A809RVJ3_9BACT|nr:hypothetical protein [Mycoplasmopsis felis]BBU47670.1 hypothetical protein JPM2_3630 [Mycoplasmopsis felis]
MNQLVINKRFLEKENNQSIRVKGQTALKVFKYLEYLKKLITKYKVLKTQLMMNIKYQ